MHNFGYVQAQSRHDAIALLEEGATPLAGGTELLNWARVGILQPARIVDISRIEDLDGVEPLPDGGVRIGAMTRLNDVAQHPLIVERYSVFSQSILSAASAQIRNLATIGGNPLQRVRCPYFRADEPTACNKREPGSGCAALAGINDRHAIFGWTDECVAVHPADPPVALAALDAAYVVESSEGSRRIPADELHVLPTRNPAWHNVLLRGELITAIELGGPPSHSAYLKIRERESYEYATVSAAVALQMDGDTISEARIALGSVAMRPWRLRNAERLLAGRRVGSPEVAEAIAAGFADARPLSHNAYKITLARNATLRAIETAARA
ncbi:xanthine dehydrogenase family protein subunit M [Pelagibacterium sp. H642]|uniref:FAD binding domain-containing protein n=1 Tax=Pelagibacterium sp. H642 TaxID=1881069 RepID=UPI002814C0AC|nr:xanthine dehydrogenase family protein subunit M [Pelagibacterium sp. H642]WMT91937.1 xanthine dehydrogenase family protein subunit M [Pelagibacterium sp. H642]